MPRVRCSHALALPCACSDSASQLLGMAAGRAPASRQATQTVKNKLLKASAPSVSDACKVQAWREACKLLQAQSSELGSVDVSSMQELVSVLKLSMAVAASFEHREQTLQLQHATLHYQVLRALHQQQAWHQLLPSSLALLDFLKPLRIPGSAERCEQLRYGTVAAAVAALEHAEHASEAFLRLCAEVSEHTQDSSSSTEPAWPTAYRMLVTRLRVKDQELAQRELSCAFALLQTAAGADVVAAQRLVPHLVTRASTTALLTLVSTTLAADDASCCRAALGPAAQELARGRSAEALSALRSPTQLPHAAVCVSAAFCRLASGAADGKGGVLVAMHSALSASATQLATAAEDLDQSGLPEEHATVLFASMSCVRAALQQAGEGVQCAALADRTLMQAMAALATLAGAVAQATADCERKSRRHCEIVAWLTALIALWPRAPAAAGEGALATVMATADSLVGSITAARADACPSPAVRELCSTLR